MTAAGPPAPGSEDTRDRAWLAAIVAGGAGREQGTRALFMAYRAPLRGWLRRHRVSDEAADDVLQEAFIKLVAAAADFRDEGTVRGWMYTIVRHQWLDTLRRKNPELQLDDDGWQWVDATLAAVPEKTRHSSVEECVADGFTRFGQAHPERAEALRRMVLDGWSVRQVALYIRRTERATYEYLSQCRKRLRPFIEPCLALLGPQP